MAEKKFFVSNGQSNVGPFTMHVIIEKVNKGEFKATDHVCVDADKDEWILICQHPEFLNHYESAKSGKPSINKQLPTMQGQSHEVDLEAESNDAVMWDDNSNSSFVPDNTVIKMPSRETSSMLTTHEETRTMQTQSAIVTPLPQQSTKTHGGTDSMGGEWYVLKGKNRFGPFMYLDVVRMLQEKSVFEYDYVWHQSLDTWKRIAQVPGFSPESIRGLFTGGSSEETKIFHRRNYKRSHYETTVVAHDNKTIWKGKTLEVSEGGAGIVIENAMILPGQNVYVHFKPGPLSKPFNVLCEVVSKRYMGDIKDSGAPVIYGIKFINITKQDREAIRNIHSAA